MIKYASINLSYRVIGACRSQQAPITLYERLRFHVYPAEISPKYCQYGVKHHIINQSIHVYGFYLFAFSSRVYSILHFSQNIILMLAINPHERALGPHKKAVAILNNYVDSDKYRIFTSKRT